MHNRAIIRRALMGIRILAGGVLFVAPGIALVATIQAPHRTFLKRTFTFGPDDLGIVLVVAGIFAWLERQRGRRAGHTRLRDWLGHGLLARLLLALPCIPLGTAGDYWTADDLVFRFRFAWACALIGYVLVGWGLHLYAALRTRWHRLLPVVCIASISGLYLILAWHVLFPSLGWTGDEPHYLVVTQSIVEDGDLNVRNNYLQRTYRAFMGPLRLKTHAWPGRSPRTWYSMHMPGVSVLTVPWYVLARIHPRWFEPIVRSGMVVWAVLALIGFYRLARMFGATPQRSLLATGLLGVTVPYVCYATHLYPEMIAAACMVWAFILWWPKHRPIWTYGLAGGLVGGLIWLGVKYIAVIAVWATMSLFRAFRSERRSSMLMFLACVGLHLILFEGYLYGLYGQLHPLAPYMGGGRPEETRATFRRWLVDVHLWNVRGATFLNYWLDQRDGLLPYSPVYLWGLIGVLLAVRTRRSGIGPAVLIFLAHTGLYVFSTIRGGFAPPARPLASVLWVIALGWVLDVRIPRWLRTILPVLVTWSCIIPVLLYALPPMMYQSTNHDVPLRAGLLFEWFSNVEIYLPGILPSYAKAFSTRWWPNYIWGPAVGILIVWTVWQARREPVFCSRGNTPANGDSATTSLLAAAWIGVAVLKGAVPQWVPQTYTFTPFAEHSLALGVVRQRCQVVRENRAIRVLCPQRARWDWIVRTVRPPETLSFRVECTTPGRPLDYAAYWYDLPLHPRRVTAQTRWYVLQRWSYWVQRHGKFWGLIRVTADHPHRIACRAVQLTVWVTGPVAMAASNGVAHAHTYTRSPPAVRSRSFRTVRNAQRADANTGPQVPAVVP